MLGSPVAHSLSPVLHRAAYDHLGLTDWSYDAVEVDEAGLAGFLAGLDPSWAGLSLTMPLKAAVLPLLDATPRRSSRPRAPPTRCCCGTVAGWGRTPTSRAWSPRSPPAGVRSVDRTRRCSGGGATARSAVVALAAVTRTVTAYVRDPARRAGLEAAAAVPASQLEVEPWARAVDGLHRAAGGEHDPCGCHATCWCRRCPATVGALFEVLYDPWPTPLAAAWVARGGAVVDGLDLLVHQAVLQVSLMTGVEVEPGRAGPGHAGRGGARAAQPDSSAAGPRGSSDRPTCRRPAVAQASGQARRWVRDGTGGTHPAAAARGGR